ncbi:transketolase family protein (plasmid) [Telmatobacter bradus]|uniref:transketolase family protein n=1 Tax=Telmatobacter bradus TaxID=474953 RepID=UPI003B4314AC
MRTAFIKQLCAIAEQDERVWLLCGDLGYNVLDVFANNFPARYLNAGVAEQNMTGTAAGLALQGKTVFTYSIANFPVMRCLEQIRNDVCYHNLNVKIVAVGGGLAYGSHGYTHHGVEDLAVMSAMPNLTIAAPADPIEARAITSILANLPGPAYLRLGKAGEPVLHAAGTKVELGKAIQVADGSDLTIISIGGMLGTVLQAAEELHKRGIHPRLLSMPFLIPLDTEAILKAAEQTGAILTVEEHGSGGLGTAVAEALAISGRTVAFRPLRLAKAPIKVSGSQQELRSAQGLSVEGIIETAEVLCLSPKPRVMR